MLLYISLIVLNALIAFMGDSYNKVSEQRYSELSRERASLIVELYTGLDATRRAKIERATRWAYNLMPASDLEDVNGAEHEWEGELAEIKRAVRKELATMASKAYIDDIASRSKADLDAAVEKLLARQSKKNDDDDDDDGDDDNDD